MRGFEPVSKQEWEVGNWSSGCQRKKQLECGDSDGFSWLQFMKVPDFARGQSNSRSETKGEKVFEAGETFVSDSTAIVLNCESEKVKIGELPEFTFLALAIARDQFHENNLLGRGGFGPVYKCREIWAMGKKLLSRDSAASGQGMQEFVNEVIVISKLQHRNLVRLLGWCIENEEKMLTKHFNIIEGIARGLLYIHKDSRLRIIHRDLKPSNVLLDEDWNPKISDFGTSRAFGGNQDHDNTARVVGTYGYMAPEYAMEGRFSKKYDVYSFGVLMLEIIKGEKNTHYYNHVLSLSLLGCAWKIWIEDNGLAFVEQIIASSNLEPEINRCIQIALLCVQEFAKDRPTIQTVLSMLSHEIVDLPPSQQPVFAEKWNDLVTGSTQPANQLGHCVNEITLTVLDGR
ncbi:hypothetical protein ACS0TY_031178 [Phlomoides rotata]